MKYIISVCLIVLTISIAYYLLVYLPKQGEIEAARTNIEIKEKQSQLQFYENREKTTKMCSSLSIESAKKYIKNLVYPQPIPDGNKLYQQFFDRCMNEYGYN